MQIFVVLQTRKRLPMFIYLVSRKMPRSSYFVVVRSVEFFSVAESPENLFIPVLTVFSLDVIY